MAAGDGRSWKIFGIIVIALLIAAAVAAAAFFIGRGCEEEKDKASTTTTRTQPAETAPADVSPEESGAAGAEAGTEEAPAEAPAETTATTERYVTGEGEGSSPCIDGFQTTSRTTYWSDGSTDTVTITEPCTP